MVSLLWPSCETIAILVPTPNLATPAISLVNSLSHSRLITVPQPQGLYGLLLYPTSTTGTAGLTLDFTVVHPVGRRVTEYACDENTLHRAYRTKVTTHHEWLQAKNYWFVPVAAAASSTTSYALRRTPPSSTQSRTP